jgi:FdhD protein
MGRVTVRRRVVRWRYDGPGASRTERVDILAAEEPLEVRQGTEVLTVTMRTPGDDLDLVAGWLVAEGLVRTTGDLVSASFCLGLDAEGHQTYNVVEVVLAAGGRHTAARRRSDAVTTSACGVCGAASIDAVRVHSTHDVSADPVQVPVDVLLSLPGRLRSAQKVFARTGGLHAAGLFTAAGEPVCVREDVGRHNAVDKVVGWALREGRLPLRGHVLQVSGRASFELVQKAALAGLPVLSAVSAPSSLAVQVADEVGLTLAGFVRPGGLNLYAKPERVPAPPGR